MRAARPRDRLALRDHSLQRAALEYVCHLQQLAGDVDANRRGGDGGDGNDKIVGGDGLSMFSALGIRDMKQSRAVKNTAIEKIGADFLVTGYV